MADNLGCAYCGANETLTKEHLMPRFLIQRCKNASVNFSEVANRVFEGEPTIRDVCRRCNNGALSELDAYVTGLYDQHFDRIIQNGDEIRFAFDYDQLVRWLLKMSYNSARTKHEFDSDILSQFRGFMLGAESPQANLAVMVQLIVPYDLSEEDEASIDPKVLNELPLGLNQA